jgi:hypothetical protein
VELPLKDFARLPVAGVDWLTIEFISEEPNEFFVDDLQLLGPWEIERP